MKSYGKKIIDEVINWGVPVLCAGALLAWDRVPPDLRHYWPVLCVAMTTICSLAMEAQTRREVKRLRAIHEEADKQTEEKRKREDDIASAFKAMLDDDMGKLYEVCLRRGYTTEDERRRYRRLDAAYKDMGGNGEATERKQRFFGLMHEEEWKIKHERMDEE